MIFNFFQMNGTRIWIRDLAVDILSGSREFRDPDPNKDKNTGSRSETMPMAIHILFFIVFAIRTIKKGIQLLNNSVMIEFTSIHRPPIITHFYSAKCMYKFVLVMNEYVFKNLVKILQQYVG